MQKSVKKIDISLVLYLSRVSVGCQVSNVYLRSYYMLGSFCALGTGFDGLTRASVRSLGGLGVQFKQLSLR